MNSRTDHMRVHDQKQSNLCYVGFPVFASLLSGEQLVKVADFADDFGEDVRLTRQLNLIVPGVSGCGVYVLVERMEQEVGLLLKDNPIRARSISCAGRPHCNFSVGETKGKLMEVFAHLEEQFGDAVADLCVYLDVCPHACGQHWVGDIGLQATTLTTATGEIQAYDILLRGGLGTEAPIAKALLRRRASPAERW